MEDRNNTERDSLLTTVPGGIVKLAFDDMLTILYTTDKFYGLVNNAADKTIKNVPQALLRIIYSADIIYVTQQIAPQKLRADNMIQFNFRTLQPDGSFKWIMITGNKLSETYQSGKETVPVYSCMAMDITDMMIGYKKLEQTIIYHSKIDELSRDLYFEYEIAKDTLTFNNLFREMFGKESVLQGFRSRLEKTKLIHSDELPAVNTIYNSMMRGRKQARFELRLIPKDGIPCWYICYASIIYDENRNPYQVVGKLSTLNRGKKEQEKSVFKPQTDSLTTVLNKESAEVLISEWAKKQEPDELSALFLIEFRNYKASNEIRKSIHRENILTGVGKLLKQHFRTSDIIGRTGQGEFVAYMKSVASEHSVYETADQICRETEENFSNTYAKNGISVSIGIALHLGTAEYPTLMAKANTALVIAKKEADSSFEVFSGTNS